MRMRLALAGLLAFGLAAVLAAPALAAGPIAVTPSGALEGVANGACWSGAASRMRLLPSVPSVGARRLRPARGAGVRDATAFGSPCLQPLAFDYDGNVT